MKKSTRQKKYIPAKGAHLSSNDAIQIGKAVEILITKIGREPTTQEFAKAVRSPKNPAHSIVRKKYKELMARAWDDAASYCIRGIEIIWVETDGQSSPPMKAFFVLNINNPGLPNAEESAIIYPADRAANNVAVLAAQEIIMRRTIATAVSDFAGIAGFHRARNAAIEEIESLAQSAIPIQNMPDHNEIESSSNRDSDESRPSL